MGRCVDPGDAGIVHHDIDLAELFGDGVKDLSHRVGISHVELPGGGGATLCLDVFANRLGITVVDVGHGDTRALAGQAQACGLADAIAATGDDAGFSLEAFHGVALSVCRDQDRGRWRCGKPSAAEHIAIGAVGQVSQAQNIKRFQRAIGIGILDGEGEPAPVGGGDTAYLGAAATLVEQQPRLGDRQGLNLRCHSADLGHEVTRGKTGIGRQRWQAQRLCQCP